MKSVPMLASLALAASVAGCGPPRDGPTAKADPARVIDAIKADEVHWNADWKSGDPAKVAAHFAPTASVMAPGRPPLVGAAAIRAGVQEVMDDPGFSFTFVSDTVDVAASGDLAAARGTFRQTANDPKTGAAVSTRGAFVTVYQPQPGGVWKAVWDIATDGGPAPAEDEPPGAQAPR